MTGQPRFDVTVPPGGYAWWYVDALSDDGTTGLTIIGFIGSVFSPYYARARRRAAPLGVDPLEFCALNVALYRGRGKRWALTERSRASVLQSATTLAIGPSALSWDGTALRIEIDEVTVPFPARLQGTVTVHPESLAGRIVTLDREGLHRWQAIAPAARVEARFTHPQSSWSGTGYLDTNSGALALEDSFTGWTWSRAPVKDGTVVLYDVARRTGEPYTIALRYDRHGASDEFDAPPRSPLPRPGWGVARETRSESGHPARLLRTLEDTPFYARSVVRAQLLGEPVTAMHESLSLERFSAPWVQVLLPFRMPRVTRARRPAADSPAA